MRLSRSKMLCYRSLVKDNRASDAKEVSIPLAANYLVNDFREGTALAVPRSLQNSRALSPEAPDELGQSVYETHSICLTGGDSKATLGEE